MGSEAQRKKPTEQMSNRDREVERKPRSADISTQSTMPQLTRTLGASMVGALCMYYGDPQVGKRRRAELKNRAIHAMKVSQRNADMAARDMSHRVQGFVARGKKSEQKDVGDEVLAERVRALLGRYCSHPHAIEVVVKNGEVELFGPILSDEKKAFVKNVGKIAGVVCVHDQLHGYESSEHIPALQGGRKRRGPRVDVLQDNWAPSTRWLMGTLGLGILTAGLRERKPVSVLGALLGGGMLTRAITNQPLQKVAGVGPNRYRVDIQKTMHIDAPVEDVFSYFENLELLPQFMDHIEEIRKVGENQWHWKVSGPAKLSFEWDAESHQVDGQKLSWRTHRGSGLENSGVIRFTPENGGTLMHIQMSYEPPVGLLGHRLAKFLGADPKHYMDEDLLRLKSLLEEGKATAHGQTVLREEIEFRSSGYAPTLPS